MRLCENGTRQECKQQVFWELIYRRTPRHRQQPPQTTETSEPCSLVALSLSTGYLQTQRSGVFRADYFTAGLYWWTEPLRNKWCPRVHWNEKFNNPSQKQLERQEGSWASHWCFNHSLHSPSLQLIPSCMMKNNSFLPLRSDTSSHPSHRFSSASLSQALSKHSLLSSAVLSPTLRFQTLPVLISSYYPQSFCSS